MKALGKAVVKEVVSLNDIIEQTYYLEQKVYELNKKIEANKVTIKKRFKDKTSLVARVDEDLEFTAVKNTNVKLEFYIDQLQKTLTKEQFNKVIEKTVVVDDLDGLIKTLKWYGVPPKEFKTYISTIKKVDEGRLDSLIEIGEIEAADLQGCYKAEFSEEIKIKKTK